MGEFKAGALFIGLVIYFSVFIIALTMVENVATTYGLDYSITTTGNTSLIDTSITYNNQDTCLDPRKSFNAQTGEYEELSYFHAYSSQCKYTTGAVSEGLCNEINGCTWSNNSEWYYFGTKDQTCNGLVNLSVLGITQNYTQGNDVSGSIEDENGQFISCALDGLNENACLMLGCQWGLNENEEDINKVDIFAVTGALFTFSATFTTNALINFILTTLLFYIPLVALAVSIYFMLPSIH